MSAVDTEGDKVGSSSRDHKQVVIALSDKLDSMLENDSAPTKILDFLTTQKQAQPLEIIYGSLLSDRMFNIDFLMKLNYGYINFLMNLVPKLDSFTRTHLIWQILQCRGDQWTSKSGLFYGDLNNLRNRARSLLTERDMCCHPYTGSMTNWLQPFDNAFFESRSIYEAAAGINDRCFAEFNNYVKDSLWLSRIYQVDFFACASMVKQMHMHQHLGDIPVLTMLKFVAQILHSSLAANVKLAFWKKANELEVLGENETFSALEAIDWLASRCKLCPPLADAMFQFPHLYDRIYDLKFDQPYDYSADIYDVHPAWKFIHEFSSFEEVALNTTLIGEELGLRDVEYMLETKKFSMVGEMAKSDLDTILEILPLQEILFIILKYVKESLCIECLEAFEKHSPGIISSSRDYYGNNALWSLLHRRTSKSGRKSEPKIRKVLVEKYGCDPTETNIYGLSYDSALKMFKSICKGKEKEEEERQ